MRRHWKKFVLAYLICEALSLLLMWMDEGSARPWEGPWHAQVVDAETRQPLEGVVVLAWWTRYLSAAAYYDASQEKEQWKQFRTEGVVIELPRLKTPEDWKKYRMLVTGPVPPERMQQLEKAFDDERIFRLRTCTPCTLQFLTPSRHFKLGLPALATVFQQLLTTDPHEWLVAASFPSP